MFVLELKHPTQDRDVIVGISKMPPDMKDALSGGEAEKAHEMEIIKMEAGATLQTDVGIYRANYALKINEPYDGRLPVRASTVIWNAVQFFVANENETTVLLFPAYFPRASGIEKYGRCVVANWDRVCEAVLARDARVAADAAAAAAVADAASGPAE
jgi:hypothetical protein